MHIFNLDWVSLVAYLPQVVICPTPTQAVYIQTLATSDLLKLTTDKCTDRIETYAGAIAGLRDHQDLARQQTLSPLLVTAVRKRFFGARVTEDVSPSKRLVAGVQNLSLAEDLGGVMRHIAVANRSELADPNIRIPPFDSFTRVGHIPHPTAYTGAEEQQINNCQFY